MAWCVAFGTVSITVRVAVICLVGLLAALSLIVAPGSIGAAERPLENLAPARSCGPGAMPAVIGKRLRCLRVGGRCRLSDESDLRRYGFTCNAGILRKG